MTTTSIQPPPTLRLLAVMVVAAVLLGGCGGPADPPALFESLPPQLLDRGALWRADGRGQARLAELLGLDEGDVGGSIQTGAPAVTLLAVEATSVVRAALEAAGYVVHPTTEAGWTVVVRETLDERTIGVPAVGLAEGLVVVGSVEEIEAVMAQRGDPGTSVPTEFLSSATVALAGTQATATERATAGLIGTLPAFDAFLMTGSGGERGVVALSVQGAEQADAVALSVRISTALLDGGMAATTLLRPADPLSTGNRVVLNVEWLSDPERLLDQGLEGGLAGILGSP